MQEQQGVELSLAIIGAQAEMNGSHCFIAFPGGPKQYSKHRGIPLGTAWDRLGPILHVPLDESAGQLV